MDINQASEVSTMSHGLNERNSNIKYSQNEIVNKKLLEKLINQSSIKKGDLVYDIGAGSGTISKLILKKNARVIAIEKDEALYLKCKQMSIDQHRDSIEVLNRDFLEWEFPPGERYKVFANIPFFLTAEIIRKLVFNKTPPEDCYLIVQKQAAEKYAGIHGDTLISLLIKLLFWVDILYHFNRKDFFPVPSVDIVLLQLEKRKCRLIPECSYELYKYFVIYCREGTNKTIKQVLKNLFTYNQTKRIFRLLGIDYHARPAELSFHQYLCLFQFYLDHGQKNVSLTRRAENHL